jgi:hypothetical protein
MGVEFVNFGMNRVHGDKRRAPRYPTFLAGQIQVGEGHPTPCVIRDLSRSGARLELHPEAAIPATFELRIMSREAAYTGKLVWRDQERAGVRLEVQHQT